MKKTFIITILLAINTIFLHAQSTQQCNNPILFDDYNSSAPWTFVGPPGSYAISGGLFKYVTTPGGAYRRGYRFVPGLATQSKYFIAQCKFIAVKNINTNGPGHHILTLTKLNIDPVSFDASGGYAANNNDAIIVDLTAKFPPFSNTSDPVPTTARPWEFNLRYKVGTTLFTCPFTINMPSINTWYYIKLERAGINGTDLRLSVFSDPNYTVHIPGSPITWCGQPITIDTLNYVNHGVYTWAGGFRKLRGAIDSLKICRGTDISLCPCPTLTVNAGPDLFTCCPSSGTQLNATVTGGSPAAVSWSPANNVSNPNILNPIADAAGTYIITVTNNCGQVFSDTVVVTGTLPSCCRKGSNISGIKHSTIQPNPFKSSLTITLPDNETADILISNMYGTILEQKNNVSGVLQAGSRLQPGSYQLTILYKDGSMEKIPVIKAY